MNEALRGSYSNNMYSGHEGLQEEGSMTAAVISINIVF